MKQLYSLFIFFILISSLTFAQAGDSQETLLEQEKARASEQVPFVNHPITVIDAIMDVTHPLFVGVDDVTVPAYVGDVSTNEWLQAFIGAEVWGAAYNNLNDKVYFNDGSILYEWLVTDTIVVELGTITASDGTTALSMVSLAWYDGVLYGARNTGEEAIYAIDTGTLIATISSNYDDNAFDFGGLTVDPNTGDFYGTSDDSTPLGRGIYRINPAGDSLGTFIAPYPNGETDIDGLTMSPSGILYLLIDQPDSVYLYDLVAGTYITPLTNPWTSSEIFCGAAWISGIVPVELTSFTSSVTGNDVRLSWQTASELNNSGFSVERKSGNSEYSELGFVSGFGTTTERKSYSFNDRNLSSGNYTYRLKQVDFDGTSEYSHEIEVDVNAPAKFNLNQNYPNPFNPSTKITFTLAIDSKVSLKVFNVIGEVVTELINQNMTAGEHNFEFDASGINSGVYFYRIEATGTDGTGFVDIKKMTLMK